MVKIRKNKLDVKTKVISFLVLGAGPAGLTIANRLLQSGEDRILVLESESVAGGLCRSAYVDGSPFDIGGGHFLDVKRMLVNEFLFSFMPEKEWERFSRKTSLVLRGIAIGQPLESHIWQFPINDQVEYLKSIALAGCNTGAPMPKKFINWIYWKLGERIADDYMIPYNQKLFGGSLDSLGTYWLDKLPNVSFDEILRSCLERKKYGRDPGHTEFYYPKEYGFGELWLRMAKKLEDRIEYQKKVVGINFDDHIVLTSDGYAYKADKIITTIPWTSIEKLNGMPENIKDSINQLKYSSIQTEYHAERLDTDCHWIYYSDKTLPYHRILVRHNFCSGSKGYWTETNKERVGIRFKPPLQQKFEHDDENISYSYMNEYAYPLNTINKPEIMKKLLSWSRANNVYGLGRWGEWEHYNSDVVVERAIELADELMWGQPPLKKL